MTACDCPASMSKSTPMSPDDAQRSMNVAMPASEPQVNEPAAPPVETMYFTPACASSGSVRGGHRGAGDAPPVLAAALARWRTPG